MALLLGLALAGGAWGSAEPTVDVELDMEEIHRLSVSPDATEHRALPIERGLHGLTLGWEFETTMTWGDYPDWLRQRLPKGFEQRRAHEWLARFTRQLPADVQVLEVRRADPGEPTRVSLRLESRPF